MASIDRHYSEHGFTLVELMVTMAILGAIMVGVIGVLTTQNRAYHSEESILDMQMNNRVGLDRLVRIIRMAGFGCAGNINKGISNDTDSYSKALVAVNSSTVPDKLTVISGWQQVGMIKNIQDTNDPHEKLPKSDTIQIVLLPDVSNPFGDKDSGFKKYLFIAPAEKMNFLTIDSLNSTTLKLTENVVVTEGSAVFKIRPYTFRMYTDSYAIPCLGIDDGSGIDSIAENIEDFQLQYGWDADHNGTIGSSEWVNDPSGNEEKIQAIRIYLLTRSAKPDREFLDRHDDNPVMAGKQYIVADHIITLDTNDSNGLNSTYDHHYHRFLTVTVVFLRNLNLL